MNDRAPRILIVDDNEHNIRLLQSILEPRGYDVVPAYDGVEALELVEETSPDLILLDIVMPRMDGYAVTEALRAREDGQSIPILMLTSLPELSHRIKGLKAGADDFLNKPFISVELLARVRSLLRIKQMHDDLKRVHAELQTKNALLERVLTRYVSEEITQKILSDPDQNLKLGGQSCQVSVLFADIRGFTHFSTQHDAAQVTDMLNQIFNALTPLVFEHHGTLDKYLGDSLMAFYGAPIPSSNSPEQAVRTAWALQQQFARLEHKVPLVEGLGLGIGICTGEAVVGNIGSERVMDYTVIGNTPNTAKRLEEHANAGQILIDEHSYRAVEEIVQAHEVKLLNVKGHDEPLKAYELLDVRAQPPLTNTIATNLLHNANVNLADL